MIPQFDENGFLPEGVWDCSVEELRANFGGFRGSEQRPKLFEKLENFISEVSKTEWIEEIIIDGSFVTSKEKPNDIDILIGLHPDFENAKVSFWESRLLDKAFLRKKYGFDIFVEIEGSFDFHKTLDFFGQIKQSETRKGVVRLIL